LLQKIKLKGEYFIMYDKTIKFELYTKSVLVSAKPCWLFAIIPIVTGTGSVELQVLDGTSSIAPIKMDMYSSAYHFPIMIFNEPVYFEHGLYLLLGASFDMVMVQYKEE
jgi:hypothetical protein